MRKMRCLLDVEMSVYSALEGSVTTLTENAKTAPIGVCQVLRSIGNDGRRGPIGTLRGMLLPVGAIKLVPASRLGP